MSSVVTLAPASQAHEVPVDEVARYPVKIDSSFQPYPSDYFLCIVVDRTEHGLRASILGGADASDGLLQGHPISEACSSRAQLAEAGLVLVDGQRVTCEAYVAKWRYALRRPCQGLGDLAARHRLRVVASLDADLALAQTCKSLYDNGSKHQIGSFEQLQAALGDRFVLTPEGRLQMRVDLGEPDMTCRMFHAVDLLRWYRPAETLVGPPERRYCGADCRVTLHCEWIDAAQGESGKPANGLPVHQMSLVDLFDSQPA